MKHFNLLFILMSVSITAMAQPPFYWSTTSTDTAYYAMNHWMITDSFANVYQLGQHYLDTSGNYLTRHQGFTLAKYSPTGNKLWQQIDTGGTFKYIAPSFFCLGDNNSVYVTGGQLNPVTGIDATISKYDFAGNLLWKKYYNGVSDSSDFAGTLVLCDSAFYLCGNTVNLQYQNVIFIQKYDLNGNLIWTVTDSLNNIQTDGAYNIEFDNNHNLLVTGITGNTVTSMKMYIAKYDLSGIKLWQRIDSGSITWPNFGQNIIVDNQNNIYVRTREGVAKFDSTGVFLWRNVAATFGLFGIAPGTYNDMKLDSDGNIYLAGYDGVPGGIDYTVGYLFVKLRPDGSIAFSHNPVISGTAYSIDFLNPNEILVCGAIDTVASVINYDSLGNIHWTLHYPYDEPNTGCTQVAVDVNKDVLLSGMHYVFPHKTIQLLKYGVHNTSILKSNFNANSFSIYPNPTSSYIQVNGITRHTPITITNLLGQELFQGTSETESLTIDVSALPDGFYFLNRHKFIKGQ